MVTRPHDVSRRRNPLIVTGDPLLLEELLRLTADDMPNELQQEFQQFQREMRPILRASEIGIPQWSAIRTIDDDTVLRIIERVRRMHDVIEQHPEMQKTDVVPSN